jgi:type II secretory pathway predicted ATPase ExeA
MAPELMHTMEARELVTLARKIHEYQVSKNLSDAALVKKFTGVGSSKTYKRILANDLAQLDLERQLNNYRAVVALIECLGDSTVQEEEVYDDLTPALHLRRTVLEAMRSVDNDRVILLEGDTGMGKTGARKALIEKYGQRALVIEADVVWRDNPGAMLGSILSALGVKEQPVLSTMRLERVLDRLNESRICLVIEEAHHMGPNCLNLCKTLINRTPGEIVLLAMPTLWRRLEREAYEEVRQLLGNRLGERIKLDGLQKGDIKKLIERRIPGAAKLDLAPIIRVLVDRAPRHGNLAFVREVIKRVNEANQDGTVTADDFTNAIAAEAAAR